MAGLPQEQFILTFFSYLWAIRFYFFVIPFTFLLKTRRVKYSNVATLGIRFVSAPGFAVWAVCCGYCCCCHCFCCCLLSDFSEFSNICILLRVAPETTAELDL